MSAMISVIVCTYNRADLLARMLASFFEQSCLGDVDHELVVVDNNSSDDTRVTVEALQPRPTLHYVFEARQGLSCARNRGVKEARGEIIVFLDDDVIVSDRWLEHIRACFDESGADAVGGRSYLVFEGDVPTWIRARFRRVLSEVDLGPTRQFVSDVARLAGLNLGFRKSALMAAGEFDEGLGRTGGVLLGGEEAVMLRRVRAAGGVIAYDPDAVVGHITPQERLTWSYFAKLAAAGGRSCALAEPPAGAAVRLYRLARGCGGLALVLGRVLRAWPSGPDSYARRIAIRDVILARSLLFERWNLLWRRR
ncbi:MAG: glycosyltransferase [bacterium]|nr:glycosyltransferase [bacterium]